jgi:hypothetical protein
MEASDRRLNLIQSSAVNLRPSNKIAEFKERANSADHSRWDMTRYSG